MKKRQRTEDGPRWSNEEMDVAHILGSLPRCRTWFFIGQMPYNPTGTRSAIQNTSSPFPSPPQPAIAAIAAVVAPPCNPVVKEHASSPNTPLSFPVTESDERTEPWRKKSSLKRKKEYYLNIIEGLTNTKASLSQELQNLKSHCEELKEFNLKLKAREQELLNGTKSDHKIPNLEIHQKPEVQLGQLNVSIKSLKSTAENEAQKQQQQMQMANQNRNFGTHNGEGVVQFQGMFGNPTTSSSQMASNVDNNQGPPLLPDLNISIEESTHVESCQPLDEDKANKDLIKAMAAQARQRRLQIFRLKKSSSGNTSNPRQSHR